MGKAFSILAFMLSSLCMPLLSIDAVANDRIAKRFQESYRFEDQGNFTAALNEIIKVLQSSPNHYTAVLRAGWLYHLCGYYRDSIAQYRKAMELRPKAIEPFQGIMLPLTKSGRLDEAIAVAQRALRLDSNNYLVKSRLANCLCSQGKYGQATRLYAEILELYPSDLEIQLGLAWSLNRIGKAESARKLFGSVLGVSPSNSSALAGMNATRVRYGRLKSIDKVGN